MPSIATPLSRHLTFVTLFTLLLIIAVALRILALQALSDSVYGNFLLPDEQYYHTWAVDIVNNQAGERVFEYAPLPAYIIAFIYSIFSIDIYLVKLANIFFGILGCIGVFFITKLLMGRSWALAAFAAAACCRELIFYSAVPLKTSLAFFLFTLIIYYTIRSLQSFSKVSLLLLGFFLGLSFNVRPNVLLLLPVIPFALWYFHRQHIDKRKTLALPLLIIGSFSITTLPFLLHNYGINKEFRFLPVQSGFLFYCTNTISNPTPFYRPVPFASSHPDEQGIHFVIEASRQNGKRMTVHQASQYWQRQTLFELSQDRSKFATKMSQKALMLFNFSENGDHYHIGFMSSFIPFFKMFQLRYIHFMVFGYAALCIGFFRSKELLCLTIILTTYLATLLLYSSSNRFVLPLLAILIPATIWFCRYTVLLLTQRDYLRLMLISVLLGCLITAGRIDVKGSNDISNHYNNLAFIYNRNGDITAAVQLWKKSSALKQTYSDVASLFLVGSDYRQFGEAKALSRLDSISDTSFVSAAKYATLGDIHYHHNRLNDALKAYRASLQINSGQRRVRKEIISILQIVEPKRIKAELADLRRIESYYR